MDITIFDEVLNLCKRLEKKNKSIYKKMLGISPSIFDYLSMPNKRFGSISNFSYKSIMLS